MWVYAGLDKETEAVAIQPKPLMDASVHAKQTQASSTISDADDAVRGYLRSASILAEVYAFTNNGSYAGLCEQSSDLYTLEGNSGGILKFIKMVGATEVYCMTAETVYLIEAKLPMNGMFFCIDGEGNTVEHSDTREGESSCTP